MRGSEQAKKGMKKLRWTKKQKRQYQERELGGDESQKLKKETESFLFETLCISFGLVPS